MQKLIFLLLIVALTGCVSGTITKSADGSCSAEFTSVLKSADNVTLCGATASRSVANTEAVAALVRALGAP